MLVEMATADAYAIPFEFIDHTGDRPNDLLGFHKHPKYDELKPGQFTDDTQRALANVFVMLNGNVLDPLAYADSYVSTYYADPREGYSRGYQTLLKSVTTGSELLAKCRRNKDSNGSLMGVAPLGFLPDLHMVKMAATIQAITTHHINTSVYAQCVAIAAHHFLWHKGKKSDLRQVITLWPDWTSSGSEMHRFFDHVDSYDQGFRTSMKASSIAAYMIWAIEKFDNLSDILYDAVKRGGDTDSAAAVTIAVASCCPEIENNLPPVLVNGFEPNGIYNASKLQEIEKQLREKVGLV